MGPLEVALVQPIGAREAAALVAEQLALDQGGRYRAAVQGDEGVPAAAAQGMDGLGHDLLARPRLAREQDAGVGSGHAADQVVHLLHGRGAPDERPEPAQLAQLGPQRSDLALHLEGAGQVGQHHLEPGEVHGLGEVVGGTPAQRVHRRVHARLAGDQDDLGRRRTQTLQELQTAAIGQLDVDEKDVGRRGRDGFPGLLQARSAMDREPFAVDALAQDLEGLEVVVDDHGARAGDF